MPPEEIKMQEIKIFIVFVVLLVIIFITGTVIFINQFRRRRVLYDKEMEILQEEHAAELRNTEFEIQQQTMQDIGRELHDSIGQKMTLASIYVQQLQHEHPSWPGLARLSAISQILNESLSGLRSLSRSLTDNNVEPYLLYELLQRECDKVNATRRCIATLEPGGNECIVAVQIKTVVLRLVQEFIQNSLRHAHCKQIHISLYDNGEALRICMQDDGKGFDTASVQQGLGLKNMQKRAGLIHADFLLTSAPGSGTKAILNIPHKTTQHP
jgi:signal transduction histidine kinase